MALSWSFFFYKSFNLSCSILIKVGVRRLLCFFEMGKTFVPPGRVLQLTGLKFNLMYWTCMRTSRCPLWAKRHQPTRWYEDASPGYQSPGWVARVLLGSSFVSFSSTGSGYARSTQKLIAYGTWAMCAARGGILEGTWAARSPPAMLWSKRCRLFL